MRNVGNLPESILLEVLKGRHTLHKDKAGLLTDHQETNALCHLMDVEKKC